MFTSPGVSLILVLAVAEAQLTESSHLEPEHIFLALLKSEDISTETVPGMPQVSLAAATGEIQRIAAFWQQEGISAKRLRRRLRAIVREMSKSRGEFSGHRSQRGRELFNKAETLAWQNQRDNVTPFDLLVCSLEIESKAIDMLFQEMNLERQKLLERARELLAWTPETQRKEISQEHRLAKYGRDLTALARAGRLGPVIGRAEEIKQIARILVQRSKNNPLLLGDPGVGKTAIAEGLASYAASENAVTPLRDFYFVEISVAALLSGAMYRGQFEERVQEVIETARQDKNLVLFLDEIHTLMGSGAGGSSTLDAANMLKPALARGDIRCIGATTIDEYRKHIEPDGALARRFQIVWIDEPSPTETLQILRGLRSKMQEHHQIEIPDEALQKAVALSGRYITDGYQPDKAITVLDEACARRRLLTIHVQSSPTQTYHLEVEDIGQVVARRTQIPLEVILQSDEERLLHLEEELSKRVLGQDEAVRTVAEAVRISRVGLRPPGKPIVLMFAGPTGTGKTELAKALSETLFFDPNRLITLDMSEYQESHSVAKLIGSPPGYVGFGEESHLVRELRLHPYSVVLLDEIEKAHPSVLTVFLQVFDEGRLTDARGRRINCGEAIFILTSNLGANIEVKHPIGFQGKEAEQDTTALVEANVRQIVTARLSPELVNRLQAVVVFKSLDEKTLYAILDLYVQGLNRQLSERHINVELDESAKAFLLEQGYSAEFGARHLKRAFERLIAEPLSREILSGKLKAGQQIIFFMVAGQLQCSTRSTTGITGIPTQLYRPS
jgi:ATP-dependent Clp protease ATP-binding subunit ClpC